MTSAASVSSGFLAFQGSTLTVLGTVKVLIRLSRSIKVFKTEFYVVKDFHLACDGLLGNVSWLNITLTYHLHVMQLSVGTMFILPLIQMWLPSSLCDVAPVQIGTTSSTTPAVTLNDTGYSSYCYFR